jgi:hypothetical protein
MGRDLSRCCLGFPAFLAAGKGAGVEGCGRAVTAAIVNVKAQQVPAASQYFGFFARILFSLY